MWKLRLVDFLKTHIKDVELFGWAEHFDRTDDADKADVPMDRGTINA